MSKSVNFQTLQTSKNDDFIQELKSSSKIINEENASQYFRTLSLRFSTNPTNRITKAILSTFYELISTREEMLNIFAQNRIFLSLPYSEKVYNREILRILYVIMKEAPETVVTGLESEFKTLIQYECKKCLLLLYLYVDHFKVLENDQTKILEVLVDEELSQRLSAYTTIFQYITLLGVVFEKSKSFRDKNSKNVWQIIYNILKNNDDSNDILNICYITLAKIESFDQLNKIDFDLANLHLQNEEIQDSVLALLFYAPFKDQPIIKNELLANLSKLSQGSYLAILILIDICMKKPEAADYLSQHLDWIKVDHSFVGITLCLFLIIYKLSGNSMNLGKEFAGLLINFCEPSDVKESADQSSKIKVISTILRKVKTNNTVIDELCKKPLFFENLIKLAYKKDKPAYFYDCALIADLIGQICYKDILLNFCEVIKKGLSYKSKNFGKFCVIGIRLLKKYPQVKDKLNELNVQDELNQNLDNEKTMKYAAQFLKKLKNNGGK